MFFFCLVFAMSLCASVYMCFVVTCWERAAPLGSRLWCLSVNLSLSHWYPGSGVVLDCIDSWSLHPYLLLSPSKFVYFNENLLCCNGRRHDFTCSRRGCYVTRVIKLFMTWRYPPVAAYDKHFSYDPVSMIFVSFSHEHYLTLSLNPM